MEINYLSYYAAPFAQTVVNYKNTKLKIKKRKVEPIANSDKGKNLDRIV